MKEVDRLMREIVQLTSNIETNYPELYRFLDENPLTIPSNGAPKIDNEAFQNYLESLKQQLRHELEKHRSQGVGKAEDPHAQG